MAFSDEARKSAALARKIKHRLGDAAYAEFKRTGHVPPGLDLPAPTKAAKKIAAAVPSMPGRLPVAPKRTSADLQYAELAAKVSSLSDPKVFHAFSGKKIAKPTLVSIAREQARNDAPDSKWIAHARDSGIFKKRGVSPEAVAGYRNDWLTGKRIPLWAAPAGTDVALYRSAERIPASGNKEGAQGTTVPDLIGRIVGHVSRRPLDENGKPGLSFEVPYVRIRAADGKIYEYPALMSGSYRAPHVTHASFAAVDPLSEGHKNGIPTIGFGFPNFAEGPDAGPSSSPEDLNKLAEAILRANNWADAVSRRARGEKGPSPDRVKLPKSRSTDRQEVDAIDADLKDNGYLSGDQIDRLYEIAASGSKDARSKARAILSLSSVGG